MPPYVTAVLPVRATVDGGSDTNSGDFTTTRFAPASTMRRTSSDGLISTVNMASAGIYKLFNSANISDIYGQFSNFCEYHINKKCKKYKWKIQFEGTIFDRDDRVKQSNTDMQNGLITSRIFTSRGIQITDAQNMSNMMYAMGFPDILRPVQTASTLSKADTKNSGGRKV